jgi:dCMP deaminase
VKEKFIEAHMDVAERYSELSSATRLKVGSIIVKNDKIISIGYNGTPSGWDNNCEYRIYMPKSHQLSNDGQNAKKWPLVDQHTQTRYKLKTKDEVIHAERNAIDKLAKSSISSEGASIFITHAPCIECAKSIYTSGIKEVYYKYTYRSAAGTEFLEKCNIKTIKVKED